jgi:hypothetical protein
MKTVAVEINAYLAGMNSDEHEVAEAAVVANVVEAIKAIVKAEHVHELASWPGSIESAVCFDTYLNPARTTHEIGEPS